MMELIQISKSLTEYIELKENVDEQNKILKMDLAKYNSGLDYEVSKYLLQNPADAINMAKSITSSCYNSEYDIIIENVPDSELVCINRIRTCDLNKLVKIRGILSQRTKVFPRTYLIKFECPGCNNIMLIPQDEILKEPSRCGCGRKGKFSIVEQFQKDTILIKVEEITENLLPQEQPFDLRAILQGNLCKHENQLRVGSRIELIGYIQAIPQRKGEKVLTSHDWRFIVLNLKNLEEFQQDSTLSKQEEDLFNEIKTSRNPVKTISKWLFPSISGYTKAKEVAILQQFGGTMWQDKRDYIHILFYGHPGTAKSDIAMKAVSINNVFRIASGPGLSGVGLTACAKKDEQTGNWFLQAGLLPKCNSGSVLIDELEKTPVEDKKSLHTPMEMGFTTIDKAGLTAKLSTKTAILGTCNPKVYDNSLNVYTNLELPPAVVDRFDLIFYFKDYPNKQKDGLIAQNIINRSRYDNNNNTFGDFEYTFVNNGHTFSVSSLRKYIQIAKRLNPKLSARVDSKIKKWYVELRQQSTNIGYEQKKPTARVIESILRIARAIARSKMKDTVSQKEIQQAMTYFDFMYNKLDNQPNIVEESVE